VGATVDPAREGEIIGCALLSTQRGDHRNNTCSPEVFLHVLLPFYGGAKFATGSVRITPGIVVVPLRLDHVGTTVPFLGVKNYPQDAPLARAARIPKGSFDLDPRCSFFMGVQNSPPVVRSDGKALTMSSCLGDDTFVTCCCRICNTTTKRARTYHRTRMHLYRAPCRPSIAFGRIAPPLCPVLISDRDGGGSAQLRSAMCQSPVVYRLRLITADPLSLSNRTVWLAPRTTMSITPEIEYSLL